MKSRERETGRRGGGRRETGNPSYDFYDSFVEIDQERSDKVYRLRTVISHTPEFEILTSRVNYDLLSPFVKYRNLMWNIYLSENVCQVTWS